MTTTSQRAADIETQVRDMVAAYLACRTFGHHWEAPETKTEGRKNVRITLTCGQCGSGKWTVLTLRGNRVSSGTTYPTGYLMLKTGRLSTADRDVVRSEYIQRLLKGE